jgi:hypothetical protein
MTIDVETGLATSIANTGLEICGFHIPYDGPNCGAAWNFTATYTVECKAELKWRAPAKGKAPSFINQGEKNDSWLSWCGPNVLAMGTGEPSDFITAVRFLPFDLEVAHIQTGYTISKVRFIPYNTSVINSVAIHIYQGGNSPANPGTLVYEQPVTQILISENYNEVVLNTPYEIDASKELWIGCSYVVTGGFPAGCDQGPKVQNRGDLIYYEGAWQNIYDITSGSYSINWNIEGYVTSNAPLFETTYNIYRDGDLVKANHTEIFYTDAGFDPEAKHTWTIKAVCEAGGESLPVNVTKERCPYVGIHENTKVTFSVVHNPATHHITITAENIFHTVEVLTLIGQTVLSQPNAWNSAILDVSILTNGVYFVRIISENGVGVQRFVKQ